MAGSIFRAIGRPIIILGAGSMEITAAFGAILSLTIFVVAHWKFRNIYKAISYGKI